MVYVYIHSQIGYDPKLKTKGEINMTQLEKDVILLGALGSFLQEEGYSLHDVIENYDGESLANLTEAMQLFKEDEILKEVIFGLTREHYNRIKENF